MEAAATTAASPRTPKRHSIEIANEAQYSMKPMQMELPSTAAVDFHEVRVRSFDSAALTAGTCAETSFFA